MVQIYFMLASSSTTSHTHWHTHNIRDHHRPYAYTADSSPNNHLISASGHKRINIGTWYAASGKYVYKLCAHTHTLRYKYHLYLTYLPSSHTSTICMVCNNFLANICWRAILCHSHRSMVWLTFIIGRRDSHEIIIFIRNSFFRAHT